MGQLVAVVFSTYWLHPIFSESALIFSSHLLYLKIADICIQDRCLFCPNFVS